MKIFKLKVYDFLYIFIAFPIIFNYFFLSQYFCQSLEKLFVFNYLGFSMSFIPQSFKKS